MPERYLAFETAGRLLGIEMAHSRELVPYLAVAPVPQSPDWLLGVTQVRGNVLPVFSIHPFIGGQPPAPEELASILIIEYEKRWALGVPVKGSFSFEAELDEWRPHPLQAQHPGLCSELQVEARQIGLLSLSALRAELEARFQFQLSESPAAPAAA